MFKKYKLWYLVTAGVFYSITGSWFIFALTGLNIIRPSSDLQEFMQIVVWAFTAMGLVFTLGDDTHLKTKGTK